MQSVHSSINYSKVCLYVYKLLCFALLLLLFLSFFPFC